MTVGVKVVLVERCVRHTGKMGYEDGGACGAVYQFNSSPAPFDRAFDRLLILLIPLIYTRIEDEYGRLKCK